MERVEHGKTFDRHRQLTYYPVTDLICCSCGTFDFDGYPCHHMISYWREKKVLLVLDKYILQRWTKNAKVSYVGDSKLTFRTDDCSSKSLMSRHGLLAHKASLLVDYADRCAKHFLDGQVSGIAFMYKGYKRWRYS
ncbi:Protein FAR1-RELATED SEQUENCE [Abeliophyllum distichum]|uniref:Protein FAR1-RELATED SEQUENCE n=1 Tax=Abeliophyllum distichum TaxID=126358 RepID=A0ABD1SB55_9LAMI